MKLTSNAFQNYDSIPPKFTCDGEDISPALEISDVPSEAKSLVLIVHDPDAPAGDWVHWLMWNIPVNTRLIAGGEVPSGAVEGMTDFGRTGYGGPCPPSGEHNYIFELYALDTILSLPGKARFVELRAALEGHILDQTKLTGTYKRS